MEKLVCVYFEGTDSKIALFEKDKDKIKLKKSASIITSSAFVIKSAVSVSNSPSMATEMVNFDSQTDETQTINNNYITTVNKFFNGEDLSKCKFIPILSEPAIHFQKIDKAKDISKLNINGSGKLNDRTIDFIELYDKSNLAVYPSGQINYLRALEQLAQVNHKKHFKIETVKCAELSLAAYAAGSYNLKKDEISLILYLGKEYTKLIFLKGNKILHIGSTIPVGKNTIEKSKVILSKILFEKEKCSISQVDRFILCGEYETTNFLDELNQNFPERIIETLKFDRFDHSTIKGNGSGYHTDYGVLFAVADEYFLECEKLYKGINLLPKYVKEEQKTFQFGWHGYLVILMMFASIFFLTNKILMDDFKLKGLQSRIQHLEGVRMQNQQMVAELNTLTNTINNYANTKAFLDQVSSGTGEWGQNITKVADFTGIYKNLWITKLAIENGVKTEISGFSTSRSVLTKFGRTYKSSVLDFIKYEPLRDYNSYKFNLYMKK